MILEGKVQEGVEKLTKAVELNPKNYIALYNLAKLYFSQKKYKVAKELLEDMVSIVKDDCELLNMLAISYMNLKDYKAAIGIFENLARKFPQNHILLCDLGNCYLKIGEIEKAKNKAYEALNIFSDYSEALKLIKEVERQNDRG